MNVKSLIAASFVVMFAAVSLQAQQAAAIAPAAGSEKVKLKFALPPGVYTMTQGDTVTTEMVIDGQPQKSSGQSEMIWKLTVGAANDKDEKKVVARVVKVVEIKDGQVIFDSTDPAKQNADKAFAYKPLMETDVIMTLDTDDAVIEVSGLNKLWDSLSPKAGNVEQKSTLASLRIELNDKAIEQSFRRLEAVYPTKALAPGETWKAGLRVDMPYIGEIKCRYDCTLKEVKVAQAGGKAAVIAVQGKYELASPKETTVEGTPLTITKLVVQEKSTVTVNVATGLAVSDEKAMEVASEFKAVGEDKKEVVITSKSTTKAKTIFAAGEPVLTPAASPPATSAGTETGKVTTTPSGALAIPGL